MEKFVTYFWSEYYGLKCTLAGWTTVQFSIKKNTVKNRFFQKPVLIENTGSAKRWLDVTIFEQNSSKTFIFQHAYCVHSLNYKFSLIAYIWWIWYITQISVTTEYSTSPALHPADWSLIAGFPWKLHIGNFLYIYFMYTYFLYTYFLYTYFLYTYFCTTYTYKNTK